MRYQQRRGVTVSPPTIGLPEQHYRAFPSGASDPAELQLQPSSVFNGQCEANRAQPFTHGGRAAIIARHLSKAREDGGKVNCRNQALACVCVSLFERNGIVKSTAASLMRFGMPERTA